MRITIETNDEARVCSTKGVEILAGRAGEDMLIVPVPMAYTVLGDVIPPIIYTPSIYTGAGGSAPASQQYTVHIYNCQQSSGTGPNQIIPYVEFLAAGPASTPAPTAQEQVQFHTQGVSIELGYPSFLWYQTMKLTLPGGIAPIRHRLYAPFTPPASSTPIANAADISIDYLNGSLLPNGQILLSGTASPVSVLYAWRIITDGSDGAPVNLFLQQP